MAACPTPPLATALLDAGTDRPAGPTGDGITVLWDADDGSPTHSGSGRHGGSVAGGALAAAPAGWAAGEASGPPTLPMRAALLVTAGFAAQLVASGVLLRTVPRSVAVPAALASVVAQYAVMFALCAVALRRWGGAPVRAQVALRLSRHDLRRAATAFLGGLGAIAATSSVLRRAGVPLATNNPLTNGGGGASVTLSRGLAVVVLGVVMLVAAPVFEELLFRGVVLRALAGWLPVWVAVPAQGLLFGLFHVQPARGLGNLGLVAVLTVLGSVLGAVAARSGRGLGASIVAHGLHNGVAFAVGVAVLF